jgi:hypothetical protein
MMADEPVRWILFADRQARSGSSTFGFKEARTPALNDREQLVLTLSQLQQKEVRPAPSRMHCQCRVQVSCISSMHHALAFRGRCTFLTASQVLEFPLRDSTSQMSPIAMVSTGTHSEQPRSRSRL